MEEIQSQNEGQRPEIVERKRPVLPSWPTSMPGAKVTEPPVGTRRVNLRTEQVVELDYDQEEGKSSARESDGGNK